ncbi:tripartite motif-containing protein 16-like protein [Pangasianodon hypophthalmus]|uniref:tripartite motif-containing protein 16-like protein n=1 Tax=Pangasianodon hypophthalmus TaxID=310915 RepID=UPI000EFED818|nr:tripartite motif-containing protein 16-like protein [Pangasianodon hypophthalmus]
MIMEDTISREQIPASTQPDMESDQRESKEVSNVQANNKETVESTSQPSGDPQPEEVMCDSCIETPLKASKSCLTCMVSYCEEHLRPHLENSKFQSHKLVEPQLDMEQRICEHHHLELQMYCMKDSCCICPQCETEGHQGHNATPIDEARKNIESDLQQKQKEMLKTVTAAEQAINRLQSNSASIESSVVGVHAEIEQQFSILQSAIEDARKQAFDLLEGEHKQAVSQAESIHSHLKQKMLELKKTMGQVERFSKNKNHVDFLQEYTEWKKGSVDVCLPGIYISLIDRLTTFSHVVKESTQALCDLLQSTYNVQLKELCKSETLGIKTLVHPSSPIKRQAFAPEPVIRDDFLKYATNLSFNPDSTHKFLRLTEDNRKASNTTPWQHNYPDTPERFEHWRQVMTSESLYMGRHYFEVDLSGEGVYVGLTYKSIHRKGQESSSCITGNDFSWCIGRESHGFSAWHSDVDTSLEVENFHRIGCYIDYEKGLLAFYGIAETMKLINKFTASFREPLYPIFWLSKRDNTVVLVKPGSSSDLQ